MMTGMGDPCTVTPLSGQGYEVRQSGLRIVRGLEEDLSRDLLTVWIELWRGAIHAHRAFMHVQCQPEPEALTWQIHPAQ